MGIDITRLRAAIDVDDDLKRLALEGRDTDVATALNGDSLDQVWRNVPVGDVVIRLDRDEVKALDSRDNEYLGALLRAESFDATDEQLRAAVVGLFGAVSRTVIALRALALVPATRAESLFGHGSVVSHEHVAQAYVAERQAEHEAKEPERARVAKWRAWLEQNPEGSDDDARQAGCDGERPAPDYEP